MISIALLLCAAQQPLTLGPLGGTANVTLSLQSSPQNVLVYRFGAGLQRSMDGGLSFVPSNAGLSANQVYDLELDPSVPGRVLALVGSQVFSSSDEGQTWTLTSSFPGGDGRDLAVAPLDGSLLVSNSGGLWRSLPPFGTWTQVSTAAGTDPIQFAPSQPLRVYAGTSSGLLRSSNGGQSFAPVGVSFAVRALAVSPQDFNLVVVGLSNGLRRSSDGGLTVAPITNIPAGAGFVQSMHWRQDGAELWYGHLNGTAFSSDQGLNFLAANQGLGNPPPIPTDMDFASDGTRHLTAEASGGGFFSAPQGQQPWLHLGFAEQQVNDVLATGGPGIARVGASFDGVYVGAPGALLGKSAYAADFGTRTEVLARDPANPDRILAAGVGAFFDDAKIAVLTNAGQGVSVALDAFGVGRFEDIEFAPYSGSVVLAGAIGAGFSQPSIWRSTNAGAGFSAVPGTLDWKVRGLAFDPFQVGRVLAVQDDGRWAQSLDGGQSWTALQTAWPTGGFNTCLDFDPSVPGRLWRADNPGGWWVSDNSGGTWTNLGIGAGEGARPAFVPGQPEAVLLGSVNGQVLYLAAPGQASVVLGSASGGPITGIDVDPTSGALVFGTEGAGAIELPSAVPFLPLGGGTLASSLVVPRLFGSGVPSISGGNVSLALDGAPLLTPGLFALSAGQSPLPIFGGLLVPSLPFFQTSGVLSDPNGELSVVLPLPPNPNLVGLLVYAQIGLVDPLAPDPSGIVLSNALRIKLFS